MITCLLLLYHKQTNLWILNIIMISNFFLNLFTKVLKIREIFSEINELKSSVISTVVKIISTDYMIIKQDNINEDPKIIQVTVGDETGFLSALLINENIDKIKIGQEVILRNAKVRIIKGYIFIICDNDSKIFQSKNLIDEDLNFQKVNFSKYKLNCLDKNII